MNRFQFLLGVWVVWASFVPTSFAGNYTLSPVKIDVTPDNNPASIDLTNNDGKVTDFHIKAMRWRQENGRDIYEETPDFLVVPSTVRVPSRGTQTIRLAFRGILSPKEEIPYRLFVKEIPNLTKKKGGGLNFVLNMSVPVFVGPSEDSDDQFDWVAEKSTANQLKISCVNKGKRHLLVQDMALFLSDGNRIENKEKAFQYILPNQKGTWTFTAPQGPVKVKAIINRVETIHQLPRF